MKKFTEKTEQTANVDYLDGTYHDTKSKSSYTNNILVS